MPSTPDPAGEFYRVDTRRLTFCECWYATRSPAVLLLWLLKLLRIPLKQAGGTRRFSSARELVIEPAQLPPHAREAMGAALVEFAALGFTSPLLIRLVNSREERESYAATLPHPSGEAVARVLYLRSADVHTPTEKLLRAVITPLAPDRFLVTAGDRPQQESPPWMDTQRLIGASLAKLWEAHQRRLAERRRLDAIQPVRTEADLIGICDAYDCRSFEHYIARGLLVKMTPAEVEADRRHVNAAYELANRLSSPPPPPIPSALPALSANLSTDEPPVVSASLPPMVVDSETAALVVSMEEAANPKANWAGAAWLFILSLAAFVGTGLSDFSLERLAILLGVLVVHECGHFVAMRLFRYRNVRMFFLPFLGAAVSGTHFQAPGWKKALVSLAGPLPGIVIGVALAFWNARLGSPLVGEIAWMALFLNGFNLLPFLPLDGGWLLNAVLFCRHPLLEALFKAVGGVGLMALGILLDLGVGLTVFGVFLLVGIPISYRNARLARQLRPAGLPLSSATSTIPPETATVIVRELRPRIKTKLPLKALAGQALDVFERLNARPPRWLASAALMALYVLGLAGSLFGLVVMIALRRPDLVAAAEIQRAPLPVCRFDAEYEVAGERAAAPGSNAVWLATFATPQAARTAFLEGKRDLVASEQLTWFGQSVFASVPTNPPGRFLDWSNHLSQTSTQLTSVGVLGDWAWFHVAGATADPASAAALEDELRGYLASMWLWAWPPWAPRPQASASELEADRRVAATLARIDQAEASASQHPKVVQARLRVFSKALQGKADDGEKLFAQLADAELEQRRKALTKLLSKADPALDLDVVRQRLTHTTLKPNPVENDAWRDWIQQRLHAMPTNSPALALALSSGDAALSRRKWVRGHQLSAVHPELVLPAMCRWLRERGCGEVRYQIQSLADEDDE